VFPVKAGTKEPAMFGWATEATDDPAQIEAWSIQYPNSNWGLACGPSGLAVIDIDPPLGEESLFQFELERDVLPATREHKSARGGRHLIFRGSVVPTASKLGPKLDTRGGNSYILIPPSTFEGKPYEVISDIEPAPLPQFVSDAAGASHDRVLASDGLVLDTSNAKARATTLLSRYIAEGEVAIEGQGGDAKTFAVAAEVLNLGLSPEVALELMLPWNDACQPPWNIDELRVKIENASLYSQNEAGAWYVPPVSDRIPAEALGKLIAESQAAPPATDVREERGRFDWMGQDVFKNIPPPEWLIKDKLVRESIGMIYGPSGHYKSFLALDLAAQVAQKGELAFYVASEGVHRMARQDFPAWQMANGEDRIIPFKLVEDMPLMAQDYDVEAFIKSIDRVARKEEKHVGLVVLDTLNNAMLGLEENSATDAGKLIHAMKAIKKAFQTTVIVVHHTRQDGAEPRGSTALYAAFDTVLKVISKPETKLAQMFVTKQKTAELPKHPFSFQGKRVGPGLAFQPVTDKEAAVLRDETDIFAPAKISVALVSLKAWKPVTVSTQVLVGHIVPQLENESPEDRANSIARAMVGMKAAIKKGTLGGYYEGEGRAIKWSLPAPT
jgi:KaiC/GvpD/RAD55 family RecA-like ATPase